MKKFLLVFLGLISTNAFPYVIQLINATGEEIYVKLNLIGIDKNVTLGPGQAKNVGIGGLLIRQVEVSGISEAISRLKATKKIKKAVNRRVYIIHRDAKYVAPTPNIKFVLGAGNLSRALLVPKVPNTGHLAILER